MHFPSVVHLAPRRNDLFDVYSRSLTLIKITVSQLAPSTFSFFPFSSLLPLFFRSFSFVCSFLVSPFVSLQRTSRRGWEQLPSGAERNFRFLLRHIGWWRSVESDPCSYLRTLHAREIKQGETRNYSQ